MERKDFEEKVTGHLKNVDDDQGKQDVKNFLDICRYISGQYDEDESFQNLTKEMEKIEGEMKHEHPSRLFYMALPPNVFTVVAKGLQEKLLLRQGHNRIVIEKPFGKDLESSREMMNA